MSSSTESRNSTGEGAGALRAGTFAFLLVLAAYANFFHNEFHFDDDHVIVENAAIRSLAHWTSFFTDAHTFSSLPANATYRPLVTLSFAVDYAVHHSLDPVPFHFTQLLLLLIVGVLLAVIYTRLLEDRTLAIAAAALFCVHTANTETMNFISSRSELLSAIGFLTAFILFTRRNNLYLIPLAIGALAKAPVVIFAGIVIAWVRLIDRKPRVEAVKAAVPSFVTGILLLIWLNAMNAPEWIAGGGSKLAYLRTQPYVWLHYARLAILPAGLTADTDLELLPHWYDTNAIAGYLFVAILCVAIARLAKTRETAPIAFGLTWFAVTLLPTSSIFPLAEVANEHRLFFPLMGFAPAFVWTVHLLARQRRVVYATLGIFIVALAWGTHVRNRDWRTEESLWRDVTEKSPRNGRGWMNYGLTQMAQGKYTAAKSAFDRAAQYTPSYSRLEINRGIVASAMGDQNEAERHFVRALSLNPDRNAHFFYARWLLRRGQGTEAESHLAEAARLAPNWLPAQQLALQVEIGRGRATSRVADCGSYRECFDRGWQATNNASHVDAAVSYRAALRFQPTAMAFNNLGWSLASMGYREDAMNAYRAALAADPAFQAARNNLEALR